MNEVSISHLIEEGFDGMQVYQIRDGIRNEIDVTPYLNIQYSWQQMEQIKLGILQDIDISYYAMPEMPAEQMEHIREKLMIQAGIHEERPRIRINVDWKKVGKAAGITAAAILTVFVIYLSKDWIARLFLPLELSLRNEEIWLECGQEFHPQDHVLSYTEGDDVELILPTDIDTSHPGDVTAEYSVRSGIKTVRKTMTIHCVDKTPPKILLKKAKANLKDGEPFSCLAYIASVKDNCDGDLMDQVTCGTLDPEQSIQKITINVTDSSGNKAEKFLMVEIERDLEPAEKSSESEPDEPEANEETKTTLSEPETKKETQNVTPRPARTPIPEPVRYEPYDEYVTYEENGGVTSCVIHHDEYGNTSKSCEWIGAWEPN